MLYHSNHTVTSEDQGLPEYVQKKKKVVLLRCGYSVCVCVGGGGGGGSRGSGPPPPPFFVWGGGGGHPILHKEGKTSRTCT